MPIERARRALEAAGLRVRRGTGPQAHKLSVSTRDRQFVRSVTRGLGVVAFTQLTPSIVVLTFARDEDDSE